MRPLRPDAVRARRRDRPAYPCREATSIRSNVARKLLHFPGMKGSVAQAVGEHIKGLAEQSFVSTRDVEGSRPAVESAFSRLAADGTIVRVRKGLYWKGVPTSLGMSRPRIEEAALALGGRGSGPAGVAAAHWLALTSQVPSTYLTAVPRRVPRPWGQIRFTQRPVERLLRDLTPSEVAVLEVLRAGPPVVHYGWGQFAEVVEELTAAGAIRLDVLDRQLRDEPHRGARARWPGVRPAR